MSTNPYVSNINDDIFNNYMQLDAASQKAFLDQLTEDELIDMESRLTGVPREQIVGRTGTEQTFMPGGGMDSRVPVLTRTEGFPVDETISGIMAGMRDDRFEYTGLPNARFRRKMSFMDTGAEKEAFMTNFLGAGKGEGWVMDKYGRYAIMPEYREIAGAPPGDKPLIIDNPDGFEREDISDLAGSSPEIIAAIAASLAMRNYGLLPAAFGSAGATGSAKFLEEGFETGLGLQDQTFGEVSKDAGVEAALGFGGELAGRFVLRGGKMIFSPAEVRVPTGERGLLNFKTYTYAPRVDAASGPDAKATQTLVRELLDEGAIPDAYKATNRKILGRFAGFAEEIFGYNQQKNVTNVKYMTDRINGFLADEGIEPFEPFMNKVFPKLNEEQIGAIIQAKVNGAKTATEEAAELSLANLIKVIDDETIKVSKKVGAGQNLDDVGTTLKDSVLTAFDDFRAASAGLYHEADAILKGRKIIPTQPLKNIAAELLENVPKTSDGKVVAGFNDNIVRMLEDIANTPDYISAKQMSTYRTLFTEASYDPDLMKGFDTKQFGLLKGAANDAFDIAINNGVKGFRYIDAEGNTVLGKRTVTNPAELNNIEIGLNKLADAKKHYADGMGVFDNRIVRILTKADGVEPDLVLSKIISKNSPQKIKDFINATNDPETTKLLLRAAHYDNMFTNAINPANGQFSPTRMLTEIKNMGTSYNFLYGETASSVKKALTELNDAMAFIPVEDMKRISATLNKSLADGKPGIFIKEVDEYVKSVNQRFDFLDNNFNKNIGNYSSEEVIPWLVNRAKTDDIVAFQKYFGKESDEFLSFKSAYMQNILDQAFVTAKESPVAAVLDGQKLLKFLQKEGQAAKIKSVFGSETASALEDFAEKAAFLTTKPGQQGGNIAVQSVALHPLNNIPILAKLKIVGSLLSNPKTLRYLTTIIENKSARDVGFAATNLHADVLTLMDRETTLRPEFREEQMLKFKNGMYNYYENFTDEGTE